MSFSVCWSIGITTPPLIVGFAQLGQDSERSCVTVKQACWNKYSSVTEQRILHAWLAELFDTWIDAQGFQQETRDLNKDSGMILSLKEILFDYFTENLENPENNLGYWGHQDQQFPQQLGEILPGKNLTKWNTLFRPDEHLSYFFGWLKYHHENQKILHYLYQKQSRYLECLKLFQEKRNNIGGILLGLAASSTSPATGIKFHHAFFKCVCRKVSATFHGKFGCLISVLNGYLGQKLLISCQIFLLEYTTPLLMMRNTSLMGLPLDFQEYWGDSLQKTLLREGIIKKSSKMCTSLRTNITHRLSVTALCMKLFLCQWTNQVLSLYWGTHKGRDSHSWPASFLYNTLTTGKYKAGYKPLQDQILAIQTVLEEVVFLQHELNEKITKGPLGSACETLATLLKHQRLHWDYEAGDIPPLDHKLDIKRFWEEVIPTEWQALDHIDSAEGGGLAATTTAKKKNLLNCLQLTCRNSPEASPVTPTILQK
ncbi:putative signal peptide protein [Puccinia sorghi]|uniref:Putative signal peptide protein n=1 Tax=Puccinia sorghi TaxID=27349 RepID=A0A0L6URE1_9BASI|nr:putative signal peptide protein [Puccinia sorghi]